MNEIFEAWLNRIKSPLFGYSIIAFVAINWKPLFYLFFADIDVGERISYFENYTTYYSLILWPILFAAIGAFIYPWIVYAFLFLCKKPTDLRNSIQADSEHTLLIKKLELDKIRSSLLASEEKELIERAKRDQEVENIPDEDKKVNLKSKIEHLRKEKDQNDNNDLDKPLGINRITEAADFARRCNLSGANNIDFDQVLIDNFRLTDDELSLVTTLARDKIDFNH